MKLRQKFEYAEPSILTEHLAAVYGGLCSILKELLRVILQAGRILANLIVMGSGVLLRAASQAYRQAIISASHPNN